MDTKIDPHTICSKCGVRYGQHIGIECTECGAKGNTKNVSFIGARTLFIQCSCPTTQNLTHVCPPKREENEGEAEKRCYCRYENKTYEDAFVTEYNCPVHGIYKEKEFEFLGKVPIELVAMFHEKETLSAVKWVRENIDPKLDLRDAMGLIKGWKVYPYLSKEDAIAVGRVVHTKGWSFDRRH